MPLLLDRLFNKKDDHCCPVKIKNLAIVGPENGAGRLFAAYLVI